MNIDDEYRENISKLEQMAETACLSVLNNISIESFARVAGFVTEDIIGTVNGYQRFLAELRGLAEAGSIVASTIARFRDNCILNFGPMWIAQLRNQMFGLTDIKWEDTIAKRSVDDEYYTLSGIAYRSIVQIPGSGITCELDPICSYLFIHYSKWLLMKREAYSQEEPNKK